MKILYHFPNPDSIYAGRTIAYGYQNAFTDLGHQFNFLTADSNQHESLVIHRPDIFITSLSPLSLKYLNLDFLKLAKKQGTKVFVNIPFWNSPISKLRINETQSLKNNIVYQDLLKSKSYGDIFFNTCEQNDERMIGFEAKTGQKFHTILLAADKTILFSFNPKFNSQISYIGTNLPQKREFFKNTISPLKSKYQIKIYGQDWTFIDRQLGFVQKLGQYFNLPILKSLRKPPLTFREEYEIYRSSDISINIHEEYQKKYGDLNERTFKIPLAQGFEIVDNVSSLSQYFHPGKDIVVADNKNDWWDKISYYLKYSKERDKLIKSGYTNVINHHTYHHRVAQILSIYQSII